MYASTVLLTCARLQKSEAEQILVNALNAASAANSNGSVATLQRKMAHVCIRDGLKPLAHGFQLEPVILPRLGANQAFATAKAATKFASTKLKKMFSSPEMTNFSLVSGPKDLFVAVNITKLIPNPSPEVCSLLPTVAWLQPAGSDSSSSEFLSPSSIHSTSMSPNVQPQADQLLDPVYTMLDLLPSQIRAAIEQQLGLAGRRAVAR